MAQLVEQLIRNQQVIGSSPITSSKNPTLCVGFLFFHSSLFTKKRRYEKKQATEYFFVKRPFRQAKRAFGFMNA